MCVEIERALKEMRAELQIKSLAALSRKMRVNRVTLANVLLNIGRPGSVELVCKRWREAKEKREGGA